MIIILTLSFLTLGACMFVAGMQCDNTDREGLYYDLSILSLLITLVLFVLTILENVYA